MSPQRRDDGGLPRASVAAIPGKAPAEEQWAGANQAAAEKLRVRSLQRRAGTQGLQLRHSAYGYALIDGARKPLDERSDLTLDEVESRLERA